MEWDPLLTTLDSTNTDYPLIATDPVDILNQNQYYGGELPWFKLDLTPTMMSNKVSDKYPAALLFDQIKAQ